MIYYFSSPKKINYITFFFLLDILACFAYELYPFF